ncbi:hypothetical protein Pcinc_030700 [Petrolisthes cinctipes]|uniref:Serpin domain-containing protein n=1 Tax=Petrolisthes cinctipes TaxID=88211 RepID=A0AAE1EXM3_PETCI|nr:hypothetical protein Pcinc_030700 [Petrolisthes cinctipes]
MSQDKSEEDIFCCELERQRSHTIPKMGKVWWCVVACVMVCGGMVEGQVNRCFKEEGPATLSPHFPRNVEKFGLNLFREVSQVVQKDGRSVFVSPYSIWSALVLAYLGSDGETKKQMETAMFLPSKTVAYMNWNSLKFVLEGNPHKTSDTVDLNMANWAYFNHSLNLNRCLYDSLFELQRIDFTNPRAAQATINKDVSDATRGLIPELLPILPASTRFVIVNAIYFKGKWKVPFSPTETRKQQFLGLERGSSEIVDVMVQKAGFFKHGYSQSLDANIIELPYQDTNISMFVLLPANHLTTQIILDNLNQQTFSEAYRSMTNKSIHLVFPRFGLSTTLTAELKDVLYNAGIQDLLNPWRGNLTAFTVDRTSLYVDEVIHKATVEVTEEGTVAAAATGIINTRFGGPPPIEFIVTRPFVFLITDKHTGITLFAGNVISGKDLKPVTGNPIV